MVVELVQGRFVEPLPKRVRARHVLLYENGRESPKWRRNQAYDDSSSRARSSLSIASQRVMVHPS